jgi:hypothetical protein
MMIDDVDFGFSPRRWHGRYLPRRPWVVDAERAVIF